MNETVPDDDPLVRRVLQGEPEAFAELVRRHQNALWKIAMGVLGDPSAAENFVQQCFVNAFEHLHQYQLGRDFGRWLRAIARNLAREELRRILRESRRLSLYRQYLLALYDDEEDPEAAEKHRSRLERAVRACRGTLGPMAARALSLRYEQALRTEEVAAALERSETATRQLLYRIREALRRCIAQRLATS